MSKNEILSARLASALASGMTAKEAFAAVLPAVDFDAFVGELYDALRADIVAKGGEVCPA